MVKIKSLEEIAAKFARVAPERSTDYEEGIKAPGKDWATATSAAEGAWESGTRDAIAKKLFRKGVTGAGSDKWQRNSLAKGVPIWAERVSMSEDEYKTGYSPYHSVIAGLTLPPRYARGDPRNYERSKKIGDALHRKRVGGV